MPGPADFRTSTGFLLSQLGARATRSWMSVLAERNLGPHHHAILLVLRAAGPLTLSELSKAVLVDPRNMGPVLDPLESRGLLVRGPDDRDRRRRLLSLTGPGHDVADELATATARLEEDFLEPLDESGRNALHAQLRTLWAHHSAPAQRQPDRPDPG